MNYFAAQQISPHLYRIHSVGGVCMYLVQGTHAAALLDTGFGVGNLRAFIQTLVNTPYFVLLSHGHLDHAGGSAQFDTVYLNQKDWALSARHTSLSNRHWDLKQLDNDLFSRIPAEDWVPTRTSAYVPLSESDCFDLGDVQVMPIAVPGHTEGSMIFLIPEDRIAILGDACGESTLIKKEMMGTYEKGLTHLSMFLDQFDIMLRNHGSFMSQKQIIEDNLTLARDIICGRDAAVPGCCMGVDGFFGRPLQHPGKEGNIFYAPTANAIW